MIPAKIYQGRARQSGRDGTGQPTRRMFRWLPRCPSMCSPQGSRTSGDSRTGLLLGEGHRGCCRARRVRHQDQQPPSPMSRGYLDLGADRNWLTMPTARGGEIRSGSTEKPASMLRQNCRRGRTGPRRTAGRTPTTVAREPWGLDRGRLRAGRSGADGRCREVEQRRYLGLRSMRYPPKGARLRRSRRGRRSGVWPTPGRTG